MQVLAYKPTDEILGVHMIGPRTADFIAKCVKEARLAKTESRAILPSL